MAKGKGRPGFAPTKFAGVTGGGRRKQNLGAASKGTRKGQHPGMARGTKRSGG